MNGNSKYIKTSGIENFLMHLKQNNSKYEYLGGYKNDNSRVRLQCKDCGNIIERWASGVRTGKQFRCYECEKLQTIKKKDNLKEQKLQAKKQKQLSKLKDSIQLSFLFCEQCGKLFLPIGNQRKYCSRECRIKSHNNKHDRERIERARQNGKIDYSITLDKLIKRDNNICYICNRECNLNDFTIVNNKKITGNYYPSIDHVVALANGGTHSWENVRLAHRICNTLKSTKKFF